MAKLVKLNHPDIADPCHVPEQTARVLERSGWRRSGVSDIEPAPPSTTQNSVDVPLVDKSKADLVGLAREHGITGYSSMTKDELIAALR